MAKSTARRIIVSDDENPPELADLIAAIPKPGRGPAEPVEPPAEPVPVPPPPDERPAVEEPEEEPEEDEPDEDPNVNDDDDGEPDDEPEKERALAVPAPMEGEIVHDPVRYTSRITILDAWQYPGRLESAPAWVDRNWAGWGDFDPLRGIEPGPCLRVPLHYDQGQVALCRIGDFVARQEVAIADGVADVRVEVWPRESFEKMFVPVQNRPFRPFNPPDPAPAT
jgi:hypothetical protein